jgi:prolyl-tRNA editing enzyme YbaK/EbsC (Cys-tRNA(Pro) deacylase)
MSRSSVDRVRDALLAAGQEDTIRTFPDGTRSAEDAARSVRRTVAQIVKSLVFRMGDQPVLVLVSGANRVDLDKASAAAGSALESADAAWVRKATGFAIGGVAPIGHDRPIQVLIDEDLLALSLLWAAAGSPNHVFSTSARALLEMTRGRVSQIKAD